MTTEQQAQLRDLLEAQCGIHVGDAWNGPMQEGLARVMARIEASSVDDLISRAADPQGGVRDHLVNALISRETWWFRDPECFTAIETLVALLEELLATGEHDRIRIWSAGCSTGQEPYSLVISILERLRRADQGQVMPSHFEILGTDVSPAALFLAVAGRYDARAMERGLDDSLRERYFSAEGMVHCIRPHVREAVTFRQHSFLEPAKDLSSVPFDVVLLRNVLDYYADATQLQLLSHVAAAMFPGAYLFLGHGESLPEGTDFEPSHLGSYACYRRRT